MKKRIYCITTALCLVLCIVLCIAFAAVCSKAENSKAVLPEVRNNGTAIQWRDTAEEEWHDLVALNTLRGTDGKNGIDGKDGTDGKNGTKGKDGHDDTSCRIGANVTGGKKGKAITTVGAIRRVAQPHSHHQSGSGAGNPAVV